MRFAKVKVTWEKSPSNKVTHYIIAVLNEDDNGSVYIQKTVSFLETEFEFVSAQDANLTIAIVATDGLYESKPVSIPLKIGDLLVPEPIGGISVKITEIVDVEKPDSQTRSVISDNEDDDLSEEEIKELEMLEKSLLNIYNPEFGEDSDDDDEN
jgi:hypothetical protein